MKLSSSRTALTLLAPALAPQAQVWTVNADGSADFQETQDAIDAAASGDDLPESPSSGRPAAA